MFIKFFRTILLIVLITFILLIISLKYIKKNITPDIIKYNLIYTLHNSYGISVSFDEIKYLKPDNFIIKNITITSPKLKAFAQSIKINADLLEIIKKRKFSIIPQALYINSIKAKYFQSNDNKKNNNIIESILNILSQINTLSIKNSEILIINSNSNTNKIEIDNLQATKSFFSDTIGCDFSGRYINNSKTLNLNIDFGISKEKIEIKKLITQINSKNIELSGDVNLIEDMKSELELKILSPFDVKEIVNIPHSIKIEPITAKIIGTIKQDFLILSSKTSHPSINLLLKYDIPNKKIVEINIKSSNIEYEKIKDYLNEYVRNFDGKIDLEINIIPYTHIFTLKAESKKCNFKDIYNALDFKDTDAKFIMTPNFHALNIIKTTGIFQYDKITGNIRIEGTQNSEKILTNIKLNNNYIKSEININNVSKHDERNYIVKIRTENFSFQKMFGISEYFKKKLSLKTTKNDSRYDFINKKMKLRLISEKYEDDPYISAEKILINADYTKTNELLKSAGNFKIKIINGQIKNIQENIKNNKKYEILLLPVTQIYRLNRMGALKIDSELKSINFSDIGCQFKTNNGKIIVDKFYLNSAEFLIYSRGEIDFNYNKLNMDVYVINRKDYKRGALPESLTDAKGRPSLAFKVSGSFETNDIKIIDATNITDLVETEIKKSISIEE